ncbi:cytochrome c3 family protein [Membranihabitans maritimus]|uniref:cytochrome c3 family protein n=1 Tax=Membranihabitans maritimus TaxID=2904244 RepID=UPI001F00A468|nr:cytochrome c3 family protein [Membranihabitans maritimus]
MFQSFRYILGVFLCMTFALSPLAAQEGDVDLGAKLFRANCNQCHNKDMKSDLTGPALGPGLEAWADYPKEDLYDWIRNSQELISQGHPRAVEIWNEYKPTVMTPNPNLTDTDMEALIAYIDGVYSGAIGGPPAGAAAAATEDQAADSSNATYLVLGILFVLVLLVFILWNILGRLKEVSAAQEGEEYQKSSLRDLFSSKSAIGLYVLLIIISGGYFTVNRAVDLNRQEDYQPDQPIKFSHKTHAGLHQIDCQYCHDGARRSKHSVIPATNTCMNCHKAIRKGSTYGTAEITKIYASIGYDPMNDVYIEDYGDLSQDSVKAIYTAWIEDQYVTDQGQMDARGEQVVQEQWEGIVNALTTEVKPQVQGPIPWVRIHNLPDHVYFSHEQHVMAGGVACQSCHGAVEEMDVVEQHSPLSMGWCINCHRETQVNFNNEYYEIYTHYHDEIKSGTRSGVTVEDIGGTECQKCHY